MAVTPRGKKYQKENFRKKLNKKQFEILKEFIIEFLPSTGEKRKYPSNTIFQIRKSIDVVFSRYLGFGVSERDIVNAFLELDYNFFTVIHPEQTKLRIPKVEGFYQHVYDENERVRNEMGQNIHLFYVEVSGKKVNELRKSIRHTAYNSNIQKTIIPKLQLIDQLKTFFDEKRMLTQ